MKYQAKFRKLSDYFIRNKGGESQSMNKMEYHISLFWTQFTKFVICLNVKLILISKTERDWKHLADFQAEIIHKKIIITKINQMMPA